MTDDTVPERSPAGGCDESPEDDFDTLDAVPLADAPTVDGIPAQILGALYEKTGRTAKAEDWRRSLAKEGDTP